MTQVREAREDELGAVLKMYEWLFEPPGSRPGAWDEQRATEALAEALRSESSTVLVADHEQRLIGLCTAYLDLHSVRFGPRCWVEDLAVDPARRSAGVGSALLEAARSWARERGATHLELDTAEARADAQRFYEREGADHRSISYTWPLDE
jgi:GNAT superfamily N-acetyltransferase